MADPEISAEDFMKGADVPAPSAPVGGGTTFKDEDYKAYQRLLRSKKTTPEQLTKWFEAKGYGKSENAAEVLAFVRKNPNAVIPNAHNLYNADGTPQKVEVPAPPEESWGHAIASSAADIFSGVGEGWDNAQNDIMGLLTRGTDAIGLTEGSHDRVNRIREEVAKPYQDSRYVHPEGWSRTVGNVTGEGVALAPLSEVKVLEALGKTGKVAKYADLAVQGALGGAAVSGGDDVVQNTAIGAVSVPALVSVVNTVAAPVAKWLIKKYKGKGLEEVVAKGIDPADLPPGVTVEEATAAIEKLRGVSDEAKAFKAAPEPTPETAFKPTEQENLAALESKLAQEAEAFKTETPEAPVEPYVQELKPAEAVDTLPEDEKILSQYGLTPSHFDNPEEMKAAVTSLRGVEPVEPVSYEGPVTSEVPSADPTLTKKAANAEFKDLTTAPKPLTAKELEAKLTADAEKFLSEKEAVRAPEKVAPTEGTTTPSVAPEKAPEGTLPATPDEVMTKLTDALDRAASIETKVQRKLYHQARRERLAKAKAIREANPGEEGHRLSLAALKGELPKADFEGIRDQFQPEDVQTLFDHLSTHPNLRGFETVNAQTALAKLLDGQLPTASEIKLLDRVFPPKFLKTALQKRSLMSKVSDATANALNLPRSLMATFDLSAPFTQGAFLVGRKEFWNSFGSMFKAFGSERSYEATMNNILNDANYPWMQEAKLAIADIHGTLTQKEEQFMSQWAEKIPVVGRVVKASERGYTAFLNKLRADTFNSILEKAKTAGIKLEDEPDFVKSLGKFINDATGRGDLGRFNSASPLLSAGLFSPRLMASRVNLLNPINYATMHPTVRKEAIKSLLSFGGIATTVLTLAQAGGADVETDPRSSDFAKAKFGNTRYNVLGGFGPYLTLASRLYTNERKTLKGDVREMGTPKSKFDGSGTRLTTTADFFRSKLSPVASFAADWAAGSNVIGEPFEVKQAIASRFVPLFMQDLNDLIKEEGPVKGSLMAVPGLFGLNASTYEPRVSKKEFMQGTEAMKETKPAPTDVPEISAEDFMKGEDIK